VLAVLGAPGTLWTTWRWWEVLTTKEVLVGAVILYVGVAVWGLLCMRAKFRAQDMAAKAEAERQAEVAAAEARRQAEVAAAEARRDEAFAERDLAVSAVSESAWPPERAVAVRVASPAGHSVRFGPEGGKVYYPLEVENCSPFAITVKQIAVEWHVTADGLKHEEVDHAATGWPPMEPGSAPLIWPGKDRGIPAPSAVVRGAARIRAVGYVVVGSVRWTGDQRRAVDSSAWASVYDCRSQARPDEQDPASGEGMS
jgi:hypothetical protein